MNTLHCVFFYSFDEHADLLFKVVHQASFNTTVQSLALLQQISTVKQDISNRFYRTLYEVLLDTRLLTSSKHTLFLNVLFKALKNDSSLPRTKAFLKRILQICTYHQPHFVCGVLVMVAEVFRFRPTLSSFLTQPEDIEEHFEDVKEEEESPVASKEKEDEESDDEEAKSDGEDTKKPGSKKPAAPNDGLTRATKYDPKKREPLYCGAELTCLWEIVRKPPLFLFIICALTPSFFLDSIPRPFPPVRGCLCPDYAGGQEG